MSTPAAHPTRRGSIGLVLSGGGARGAYEVGVLQYIAQHLPHILDRVRIITGSSVGAVNGVYLASRGLTAESVEDLAVIWRGLRIDDLLELSQLSILRLMGTAPLRLLLRSIRSPATGLLRADGLWGVVGKNVRWRELHRQVARGRFDAVAVAATDVRSGETHLFTQGTVVSTLRGPVHTSEFVTVPTALTLRHVLASAAIPLLFSPIQIGRRWYVDGGVRYNTPLSPALRFGAESLLILGVRGIKSDMPSAQFPGIGQVVGELLDSIFLDRIAFDIDRLQRINDMMEAVEQLGTEEQHAFRKALRDRGRPVYRTVRYASARPSQDVGRIAADLLRSSKQIPRVSFVRVLSALFADDARTSGDAASFLLFDGSFADKLIALGWRDAQRAHREISEL